MSISVSCPCGKNLSVKDELAGKRGKCPQCGAPLTIPQLPKPAPSELLDLPSLSDEFDEPPAAEIIPEAVKQARARAGWVDPKIETEFKLAGDPLGDDVGKVFAPTPAIAPLKDRNAPREEKEGELVCPRCHCSLENSFSLLNLATMFASAATTGFYLRPTTPYICRVCDRGVRHEDLRGESLRTANRRRQRRTFGCLIALLTFGGLFGGCYMAVSSQMKEQDRQRQEEYKEAEKQRKIEAEKYQKEQEKLEQERQEKAELKRQQREAESQRQKEERQKKEEERKRAAEERQKSRANPSLQPSTTQAPTKQVPQTTTPPANPFQSTD